MGSFNLNCGLTGLTIGPGQQTVILPIVPYDLRYLKYLNRDEGIKKLVQEGGVTMGPGMYVCSNEGASAYFTPWALPFLGVYDDYGTFTIDQTDPFNRTMEDTPLAGLKEWVDRDTEFKTGETIVSSFLILKEAWDMLEDRAKTGVEHLDDFVSAPILEVMGFKQLGTTDDPRYNKFFHLPNSSLKYGVASDGSFSHWVEVLSSDDTKFKVKEIDHSSTLTYFCEAARKLGTDLTLNLEQLYMKPSGYYDFVHKFNGWMDFLETLKEAPTFTEMDLVEDFVANAYNIEREIFANHKSQMVKAFQDNNRQMVDEIVIKIFNVRRLLSYMHSIARMLMPTLMGPQCGDPIVNLHHGEMITTLVKQQAERHA